MDKKRVLQIALVVVVLILVYQVMGFDWFSDKVEAGNTVNVYYVGSLEDGTVFDTNIKSVAESIGLNKPLFNPLEVVVGSGSVIKGFDEALIGMKVDEEREVFIPVHLAYGAPRSDVIQSMPIVMDTDRFVDVALNDFKLAFGEEPKRGDIHYVESLGWEVKVVSVSEVVKLENLVKKGEMVTLQGSTWESEVVKVSMDKISIKQNPIVGALVVLGPGQNGIVKEVTDEMFTVDFNHPLAGKNLKFKIKLVSIE